MTQEVVDALRELNPEALFAVGLEDALVGYTLNHHHVHVAVYSYERCLKVLEQRDGMTPEEADEFLQFNTLGAYVGEDGPIFASIPLGGSKQAVLERALPPKKEKADDSGDSDRQSGARPGTEGHADGQEDGFFLGGQHHQT